MNETTGLIASIMWLMIIAGLAIVSAIEHTTKEFWMGVGVTIMYIAGVAITIAAAITVLQALA